MRIIVDENVPIAVAKRLSGMGREVTHVGLEAEGGSDAEVWGLVVQESSLLLARDHHFTNSVPFNPEQCLGIVYLRKGNPTIAQEVDFVERFFQRHPPDRFAGRLVTLTPDEVRIL